jgi:Skp family chaperone for outer membrane proteins
MPNPDQTPQQGSTERGDDASVAALRPFVDARNAYFGQLHDGWQAAQREVKDTFGAHAKAHGALVNELQQGVTDAARRCGEGLRASSQEGSEARSRAAVDAHTRYQSDVSLAHMDAAQKWLAQRQELENAVRKQQRAYADRSRDAYRNYLNAIKSAWQSLDTRQLSPGQLQYIIRLTDEVAWQGRHTGAAS